MSKLTQTQKEQLKRCVIDCTIRRLTTVEMQQYVREKMGGIDISIDYLWHVKSDLKKDSEKELNLYQKDRFALLNAIFFDRVEELKFMQKTLHEVIQNNQDDGDIQIKAVNQLQTITTELFFYYRRLSQVAEVAARDVRELFPNPNPTSINTNTINTISSSTINNTDDDRRRPSDELF